MANYDAGELYSSTDYHRALFENPKINSVLLIDTNGIVREANRAFLLSFGYEKEDIIGKHFALLFTEADRQTDMPMREIRTVLDEGQSFDNNYLVNKNKTQTWVSGESVLLVNAKGERSVLKVIQNIHTQKESEASITHLNNFNENILGAIEDAVLVLDKHYVLLKVNNAAVKLFGLPGQGRSNPDPRELFKSFDDNDQLHDLIACTLSSEFSSSKIQLRQSKGLFGEKTFEVSCIKLAENDNINALLVFRDITTQKNFEQQREDIMNFVAHELSNPLTNIILNIELLKELAKGERSDELNGCIERSQNNIQRLKKLIGELYRSTKLASGNIDLQTTAFDFDGMVDEAIESVRLLFPSCIIVKKGASHIRITADKDKLIRVLTNYLTNAIKYSQGNAAIEVAIRTDERSVITAVTDHGRGIAEKDLPYIFNRYYRVEKTKGVEGLGIGLFLSSQIITAHQGRVWAISTEGKGSTFYFSIPMDQSRSRSTPMPELS